MRTITANELSLIQSNVGLHARVYVRDSQGTIVYVSALGGIDWLEAYQIVDDIDQPVMSGTIELRREAQGFSLAPLNAASQFNRDTQGQYVPLLYPGRPGGGVGILIANTLPGATPVWPTDYREIFYGKIDFVDWASSDSVVTLQVRDLGAYLLDTQIERPTIYSTPAGQPVEQVIQKMLDDWRGPGVVSLYTPVSPGWIITEFEQLEGNLLEACRSKALQIGWECRYRYDASNVFRFTLYDPRIFKAQPDATFGPGTIIDVRNLNLSDANVRNVIEVAYTPAPVP